MNYEFKSVFSVLIGELINEKQSLGFKYESEMWKLKEFDLFIINNEISEIILTKDMVNKFVEPKPNETKRNRTHRVEIVRTLANFMIRKGYEAYIMPPLPRSSYNSDFVPYIFAEDEVKRIFETIDKWSQTESLDGQFYPQRKKYCVIFRILYSTGMRIGEVLNIRVKDIDYDKNTLYIGEAKNNRERIIPLHPNLMDYIKTYINEEQMYLADDYIFRNRYGHPMNRKTIDFFFLKFLQMAGIKHPHNGPRVHSFRHTFCVHKLKEWVLCGKDINALFPYLCAYMGHADTRCTEYYLRLTADLYPDIISKTEKYYNEVDHEEE